MNILVISNLYPPHGIGGYEERCRDCVDDLRGRGHTVTVLTSEFRTNGLADVSGEDHANAVRRELRPHGFFGYAWLPMHRLYRLERHNQRALQHAVAASKPDVIHVWNMGGISKALLHTLEQGATPVVYDISDHWIARSLAADVWLSWWNREASGIHRWVRSMAHLMGLRAWLDRRVPTAPVSALRFKHIYFCSAFLRELTVARGYAVRHGEVIHCGINLEPFAAKREFQAAARFLWVGRLAADKDPLTAIQGFLKARQQTGQDLKLELYGRGEPEYVELLNAHIRQAQATDAIHFQSATRAEMAQVYSRYDALIFSSNWGEPFALTPLEAMASRLPVIMCPDGGDAELLRDGRNAIGFTTGDADSLAAAIQRFIALPDHGEQLATTALAEVQQQFSARRMCDKIEALLLRACAVPAQPGN
jgi:glycogen synthase